MSAVPGHLDAELLSAYLDRELPDRERAPVEDHLQACLRCRQHLHGLERVTETVRALERAAPPPVLGTLIQRHIVLDREKVGLVSRWRSSHRWRGALWSHTAIMFALVFALATILFLFSSALELKSSSWEPLLVPVFQTDGPGQEPAPVPAEGQAAAVNSGNAEQSQVTIGARTFERTDDGYREIGAQGDPVRFLSSSSGEVRNLLQVEPALRDLLTGASAVILFLDGQVVEINAAG